MIALSSAVKNRSLMGHVAAKGYLSPKTVAEFDDLKAWLKKFSEYPEAERIQTLAERKDPKRAKELKEPVRRIIRGNSDESDAVAEFSSPEAEAAARKLKSLIGSGKVDAAAAYLDSADLRGKLPGADYGRLAHQVAAGQYYAGDSGTALALAGRVAGQVRADVPEADWIAGLAAFRLNKFDVAAKHFSAMAGNEATTSWLKSAAAFWAARSYLNSKQPDQVSRMLQIAADKPRTFYGLLALRLLGKQPPFKWNEPELDRKSFQRLIKTPAIARGVALYQVGELEAAEGSIARAHGRLNTELDRPFIALAHELGFANVQLVAAHGARSPDLKAAAYPVMSVKPSDGWQVDPALVHAIVRQESKFEMRVTSSSNARGLMQVLPSTAAGTMKDSTLDDPGAKAKLFDPAFNLSVGQRYVQKMFSFVQPDGNLLQLVVAYNGGPGNLQKWLKEVEYRGDIKGDLFGDERFFCDGEQFWRLQNAAIAKLRNDLTEKGWQAVHVIGPAERFQAWGHEPVPKCKGGAVYIEVGPNGRVTVQKGLLPSAEARKALRAVEGEACDGADDDTGRPERPELSAPLANYIDLVRHSAVRLAIARTPKIALRVMLAQPEYLLAMKCLSLRLAAEFHDEDDIRYLLRHLNIETYEQAVQLITRFYPQERFPQKTLHALGELLPKDG